MKTHIALCVGLITCMAGCGRNRDWFSNPRSNDGIQVGAPDDWRWARDGLQLAAVRSLVGPPKSEQVIPPLHAEDGDATIWTYDSDIAGATHTLKFIGGFLIGCQWYEGLKADGSLPAPELAMPKGMRIDYPRCVPMAWKGNSPNGYQADVEIQYPDGRWAPSATYFTKQKKAVHQHGANAGRWRVRMLSARGFGPWSDYVPFECVR